MNRVPEDKLLTVREVSELIGFSISTIYAGEFETDKLIRIKFRKAGQKRPAVRFSYLNVQGWIAAQKARAEAEQQAPNPQPTMTRDAIRAAIEPHQLKLVKKGS